MAHARARPSGSTLLRVGTVSYLNAVPLTAGLDERADVRICRALPSALADALAKGQLDIALVPVVEVMRHPDYRVIPDVAIGCVGPVVSVRLFCRVPLDRVRRVGLDTSSRTSAVLVRILLEDAYGLRPEYVSVPPAHVLDGDADAVLLIGDSALKLEVAGVPALDLGDAWHRWTGLPFVFAVWAARPGLRVPHLAETFAAAKRAGIGQLDALAVRESRRRGLPAEVCRVYLRERICYDLGEAQFAGLDRFAAAARQRELVGGDVDLRRRLVGDEPSEGVR